MVSPSLARQQASRRQAAQAAPVVAAPAAPSPVFRRSQLRRRRHRVVGELFCPLPRVSAEILTSPAIRRRGLPKAAQVAEVDSRRTPRVVAAMVDVPVGGRPGQGGDDRPCLCLAGDMDHLHRKMIELSLVQRKLRAALGKISDARSLAEAQFALGAKDSVLSALLAAPRCARRGCRREFPATAASRNGRRRALPRSCAPKRAGSGSAWDCSPPSARPRRSSGCSARCGAS